MQVQHILGTYDVSVFKIILGSFSGRLKIVVKSQIAGNAAKLTVVWTQGS